jgi:hypothetical protein
MALEDRSSEHQREVVDKYHDPTASYQMTTRDYVMRPSAVPGLGPIILTLPPVALAKGRFYAIMARRADVFNTITITDKDDSECWLGDIVFDGKCDRILLYSDGLAWYAIGANGPGDWPGLSTTAVPLTGVYLTTLAPTTAAPQI